MNATIYRFGQTEADSTAPAPCAEPVSDSELDSGWPTTRRYPRSAHGIEAAWPETAPYAEAIEAPLYRLYRLGDTLWWLGCGALCAVLGWLLMQPGLWEMVMRGAQS